MQIKDIAVLPRHKKFDIFHKNISRLCALPNCCGHAECMLGFKKHVHMFAKWNWWHSHFLLEFILVMDASPLANKKTAEIYRFSQKVCSRLDISRVLSLQAFFWVFLCWPCPVLRVYPRKLATCTSSLVCGPSKIFWSKLKKICEKMFFHENSIFDLMPRQSVFIFQQKSATR